MYIPKRFYDIFLIV